MEHKLLWPAILIMKLGIFCRFRNEPRWLKSFCPLAWRSTAESVHPRLLREASLVGHLVAILIAPFFYLLIAPLSLAWYASILRRFLISPLVLLTPQRRTVFTSLWSVAPPSLPVDQQQR
jgi:hypothetical protein